MSRAEHLLLIKQECFNQLRSKGVPEIDPISFKDDNQGGENPHIGSGAFAGVFRVRASDAGIEGREAFVPQPRVLLRLKEDLGAELAAVKVPHTRVMEDYMYSTEEGDYQAKAEKILKYYLRECITWQSISANHQVPHDNNLLEFYGFVESHKRSILPAFVSKFYVLGNISTYIKEKPMSTSHKTYAISDVAKAIGFLHGIGVVHRDIKGANIFIEPQGERFRGVLGDFGAAKEFLHGTSIVESSTRRISERWSPPEYLFSARGYRDDDGKGDIWALGCTLLEVLQEARPWSPLDHQEYRAKLRAHECPPLKRDITPEHRAVMEKCWKVKDERPSALELHLELAVIAQSCAS